MKKEENWLAPAQTCGGCKTPAIEISRCTFCGGEKCECCDRGYTKRCQQCHTAEQEDKKREQRHSGQ